MKTNQLLLPMLMVITMSSCRTSALLKATFESETIGSLPAKNIPGAPAGDSIRYSVPLQPRIKVVTSTTSSSEKALEFNTNSAPDLTPHNLWLGFKGISTNYTQPLYFYYTAVQTGTFSGLTVDLTDGAANVMARMYLRGSGEVTLVTNLATGEGPVVGTIPVGTSHTVVFAVNIRRGTYTLTIFKRGGNITSDPRPLLLDPLVYVNPARPLLSFGYSDNEFSGSRYVLENVYISRKQP